MRPTVLCCCALVLTLWSQQSLEAAHGSQARGRPEALLRKYCFDCHGGGQSKGDVALDKNEAPSIRAQSGLWESVLEMVQAGAMPPEDQPQPTAAERQQIVHWLEEVLFSVDCTKPDPGRVTIRRLNRAEYNNTVRDLLRVKLRPADDFPSDDVGEGFDNIGDVLTLPPLLFEKYLDAAERLAEAAILKPGKRKWAIADDKLKPVGSAATATGEGGYVLFSNETLEAKWRAPAKGKYTLRVVASSDPGGDEPARMTILADGQELKTFDVKNVRRRLKTYEVELSVEAGEHVLGAAFINDYYNPKHPDRRLRDRNLFVIRMMVEAKEALTTPDNAPDSHKRLVVSRPGPGLSLRDAATDCLEPLLLRAFRRPPGKRLVARHVQLVEQAVQDGGDFEDGLRLALTAVLVSPRFLFRLELDPPNGELRALDEYELASRLSYFLWSSMPDERLLRLAREKRLAREHVLRDEIRRMLHDERAEALTENFAAQWLNLRNLDDITLDQDRYPLDDELRNAMRRETLTLFSEFVRRDLSVDGLLDAPFTFVNERLARHYGLEGVQGPTFRRVSLEAAPRRGVLTHASILTLTSNPTRTSPVKRGKWILENLLDAPPPEPPPNVPNLEQTAKAAPNATLREQLELHRKNAVCASCHRQMDALGFALENFDALGRWRTEEAGKKIDASGKLPDGAAFDGPLGMISTLGKRRPAFLRCFVGKLYTFALGRGRIPADQCAIDEILKQSAKRQYRFSEVVTQIVLSGPFQRRRPEDSKP